MFRLLYQFPTDEQRHIAVRTMHLYLPIWKEKHKNESWLMLDDLLEERATKTFEVPDFANLDPADTEFENAIIELYNGVYDSSNHEEHTVHFATSVRSAVTAKQVNEWLRRHPHKYAQWRAGRGFDGPTFLDDEVAANEAEKAWTFVDGLLTRPHFHKRTPFERQLSSPKDVTELYERWEQSVL
ncbi:MAG: hypothetical protein ACHQRJ_16830 [Alphaproteobacteria bacterium]